MTNFLENQFKKAYHYLFEYDTEKLSIYGQFSAKILAYLTYAILHKNYIMITYRDGSNEIGKVSKRLSAGRFVLSNIDQKILRIVDIDDIFRIDI